jgi:hypothetical protein
VFVDAVHDLLLGAAHCDAAGVNHRTESGFPGKST